jgi:hypothetical protein
MVFSCFYSKHPLLESFRIMEPFRSRLGSSAISILLARHSYVSSYFDCLTYSCGGPRGLLKPHFLNCISADQSEDTPWSKLIPLFYESVPAVFSVPPGSSLRPRTPRIPVFSWPHSLLWPPPLLLVTLSLSLSSHLLSLTPSPFPPVER